MISTLSLTTQRQQSQGGECSIGGTFCDVVCAATVQLGGGEWLASRPTHPNKKGFFLADC